MQLLIEHCLVSSFFYTLDGHVSFPSKNEILVNTLRTRSFNPLNPELNPICYLLALLAHHFLHVSRIRVKSLTIKLLM